MSRRSSKEKKPERGGSIRRGASLRQVRRTSKETRELMKSARDVTIIGVTGNVLAVDLLRNADVLWTQTAGAMTMYDGPTTVVRDGTDGLFVGTRGFVFSLSAASGKVLWANNMEKLGYDDVQIAVHSKYIFAGTHGWIVALDRSTGAELWRLELKGVAFGPVSLALRNNILYVGCEGVVWMFDPENFKRIHKHSTGRPGPVTFAFTGEVLASDLTLISANGLLQTLDPKLLKSVGQEELKTALWNPVAQLLVGETLFVGTYGQVSARNITTGKLLFTSEPKILANPDHGVALLHVPAVRDVTVREGWLSKRGSGISKEWKRRWFVLHPLALVYYKEDSKIPVPSRVMPMFNAKINPDNIQQPGHALTSWTVTDESGWAPEFLLEADGTPSKRQWIEDLNSVADALKSGKMYDPGRHHSLTTNPHVRSKDIVPGQIDVLYVGVNHSVVAVDASTGKEFWTTHFDDKKGIVTMRYAHGLLWCGCAGILYGLNPCTGKAIIRREIQLGAGLPVFAGTPVDPFNYNAQPVTAHYKQKGTVPF